MKYYFWTVLNGVLGTATLSGAGEVKHFSEASIEVAEKPAEINVVTLLRSELDYSPLGKLLASVVGSSQLQSLFLKASPRGFVLFPPGVTAHPTFFPELECKSEVVATDELFSSDVLEQLNCTLKAVDVLSSISQSTATGYFGLQELRTEQLPKTVEVVVESERSYSHLGTQFRVQRQRSLLGLHERGVRAIEEVLLAKGSPSVDEAECFAAYKRVSNEKRQFCRTLRARIVEILCRLKEGEASSAQLESLLQWLGTPGHSEAIPGVIVNEFTDLVDLCQTSPLPGIKREFATIASDLKETIREFVAFRGRTATSGSAQC